MADRKAEAARWFHQASADLRAARWNRDGGFHDTASFLAQQAAEKAMKSLLYYLGARRTALLTHSLVEMMQELAEWPPASPTVPGAPPPAAIQTGESSPSGTGASQPGTTAVTALLEDARSLDLHYVPSRYPNGLPGGYPHEFYGPELSERAIGAAERIVAAVTSWYRDAGAAGVLNG